MQQVRPSIWVLLSKKRGLKQRRLQIAGHRVWERDPRSGNLWTPLKTEHSARQTPTAEFSLFFFTFSYPNPAGRERGEKIVD